LQKVDMSPWQGRNDAEGKDALRWHQWVQPMAQTGDLAGSTVLLGFACDEGVRRNQGRVGAREGPGAIRAALANQACHLDSPVFDAGDVDCVEGDLEAAQRQLGEAISAILERGGEPVVLGGGHEVAWGSYQGLRSYQRTASAGQGGDKLGIINFDAHFDLRDPVSGASSGTPFRQIAQDCESSGRPFDYLVLGINPAANTAALFDYARRKGVAWIDDVDVRSDNLGGLQERLGAFIAPLDSLYLTVCLDAFPAALAPGVSAPGVPGICPASSLLLLRHIRALCAEHSVQLLLMDIAEMNPRFDRDGITGRWAARIVQEYLA
jgi:formiminoglutamase